MIRIGFLLLAVQAFLASPAFAHELRPAYLEMRETAENEFAVLWKVPALGDMRLALYLRLPDSCDSKAEPSRTIEGGAFLERWTAACESGLEGQFISVEGLRATLTDVLARIEYRDGTAEIARLTPESPSFAPTGTQSGLKVITAYFRLGIDHILFGFDHLLFVLALLLLVSDRWMLVKTITAFTLAHSITLSGAALGYLSLPQQPVEATITLSIAFVASELILARPNERRLSERSPWIIALAFGLLHGFGFAGALKEIGLPQSDVPLALLAFNLGVETGQLLFVALVLLAFKVVCAVVAVPTLPSRIAAAYMIGTTAVVWLLTRLANFVA